MMVRAAALLLTLAGHLATAAEVILVILSSAITNNPRHRRMSWEEWAREGCGGC